MFFCYRMIRVCLSWWARNPKSYMYWRAKGQLLPHPDTLRKYKNCLQQKPGFLPQMFDWMVQESERLNLQQHDRVGTVILDEVSIQQDLAVLHKGCQHWLWVL